jgi:hypothetical protein
LLLLLLLLLLMMMMMMMLPVGSLDVGHGEGRRHAAAHRAPVGVLRGGQDVGARRVRELQAGRGGPQV